MEESTALWLLGLAHSEYEAVRSELDSTYGCRKAMALDLDAARKEVDSLRVERMTLRDERDAARAERDTLKSAASGWTKIGIVWVHPDGRCMVNHAANRGRGWYAIIENGRVYSEDAIEAARAAGWLDFPGASDHSAGDP